VQEEVQAAVLVLTFASGALGHTHLSSRALERGRALSSLVPASLSQAGLPLEQKQSEKLALQQR
jgi:hypothetical protein